jgi:hypothetical protein
MIKNILNKITGTHLGILVIVLFFTAQACYGQDNEINIDQTGNNLTLDILQAGYGNTIRRLDNANTAAILSGATNTVSLQQRGNNNVLGIWTSGSNQTLDAYTEGNNNAVLLDNHGNYGKLKVDVVGDNNYAWLEAGTSNLSTDNEIQLWQAGDDHYAYLEVYSGSNNSIDAFQGAGQDDNYIRAIIGSGADNNDLRIWQGKHADGTTDSDEKGDHEAYWIVTGDNNALASYQTDTNRSSGGAGHHLVNIIAGDSNSVAHTQMGKAGHDGFIEIGGDNNTVDLYQRGNGGAKWADIVLDGDGHSVDVNQRGGNNATATIDLTYGTGAYTLDLIQNMTSSAGTYSITGICFNTSGCSITVNGSN